MYRAQAEADLLSSVANAAAKEAGGMLDSYTQILVYRQDWHELQHDLLSKVDSNCSNP